MKTALPWHLICVAALLLLPAGCIPYPVAPERDDDDSSAGDDDDTTEELVQLSDSTLHTALELQGEQADDLAGYAVAVGDLDADGFDDLVVSAPHAGTQAQAGRVYVLPGAVPGPAPSLAGAEHVIEGNEPDLELGRMLTVPGDLDGDGVDDLAVMAWGRNEVWLYYGSTFFSPGSTADAAFTGMDQHDDTDSYADASGLLGSAGDLDGDGDDELLIGEPKLGRVYLVEGKAYSGNVGLIGGTAAIFESAGWGYDVLGGIDVDHDGLGDLVTGAPDLYDAAIFLGTGSLPQGNVFTANVTLDSSELWFGHSVASLGDVDGDGMDELAVAAWGETVGAERLYIYHGRESWTGSGWEDYGYTFEGQDGGDLGSDIIGCMDMDGDGLTEMAVGDSVFTLEANRQGGVFVVETADLEWSYGLQIEWDDPAVIVRAGGAHEERSGWVLAAGDLDGDNRDDLVVGAPDLYSGSAGKVRVYSLSGW